MRKLSLKVFFSCFFLVCLCFVDHSLAIAQEGDKPNITEVEKSKIIKAHAAAKKEAEAAKAQAQAAKKEVEIHKKAVELEKKKVEVEVKETEAIKKEAQVVFKSAKTTTEVAEAIEETRREEIEDQLAKAKVKAMEEKMRIAQEKALLAEEELELAIERAKVAELQIKREGNALLQKSIQTGVILFIGYLILFILVGIINKTIKDIKPRHIVRKNAAYLTNIIIIVIIAFIWIQNLGSITIILSAMGAGLIIVLQEPLLCIAGWLHIIAKKPFEVGDRIEFGGVKGDIIDIRLFQTSMLEIGNWVEADQSTGRIVNVPNSFIFKKEDFNYSRGFEFIWNEIKILVTFESDWKRAEEIMANHAAQVAKGMEDIVKRKLQQMERQYMIHYDKLTPIVYVDIKESGVELSLRYLTETQKRRSTQDELSRFILNDFKKEENVNFAYPTYRIVRQD